MVCLSSYDFVILFGFQDVICVEKFTIINKNILPKSMFQRCIIQVRRCILQLKNSVYVFRLESDNSEVIIECYHSSEVFGPYSRTMIVSQVVLRAKNFLYLLKLSRNVNHISFCTPVSGKNYRNLDNKRDSHYRAVIAQCEPGLKVLLYDNFFAIFFLRIEKLFTSRKNVTLCYTTTLQFYCV